MVYPAVRGTGSSLQLFDREEAGDAFGQQEKAEDSSESPVESADKSEEVGGERRA
jgi:hypothetical protein